MFGSSHPVCVAVRKLAVRGWMLALCSCARSVLSRSSQEQFTASGSAHMPEDAVLMAFVLNVYWALYAQLHETH